RLPHRGDHAERCVVGIQGGAAHGAHFLLVQEVFEFMHAVGKTRVSPAGVHRKRRQFFIGGCAPGGGNVLGDLDGSAVVLEANGWTSQVKTVTVREIEIAPQRGCYLRHDWHTSKRISAVKTARPITPGE